MSRNLDLSALWYNAEQLDIDKTMIRYRYQSILPYFRKGVALEVGPADGVMTRLLLDNFDALDLIDGSSELLNQIPVDPRIRKFCSLLENFEPPRRYDTIIMEHVLEHVEEPQAVLQRMIKWMNPDSVLIVGVPNALNFHRLAGAKMGLLPTPYSLNERDVKLGHYRVYDQSTLHGELQRAGFKKVIGQGGCFFKVLSNQQLETQCSTKMIEAFYELGKDFQNHAAEIFIVVSGE